MNDRGFESTFVMGCIFISMVVGVIIGAAIVEHCWSRACINHGVAQYNSSTGEWEWKKEFIKVEKESK
jgi:hypothetical protein